MWAVFHQARLSGAPYSQDSQGSPQNRRKMSVPALRHSILEVTKVPSEKPDFRGRRNSQDQTGFVSFIRSCKLERRYPVEHAPLWVSEEERDSKNRNWQVLWQPWSLRRALKSLGLPKEYIHSLQDDELIVVLADYFGFSLVGPQEELPGLLCAKLNLRSWAEFQASIRELARRMAELPPEPSGLSRGEIAAHLLEYTG
uniref:Uncharacterized protein n=1 Tax=Alexandrium andersonii TaxID=327968 RepID=A0A7S2DMT6_9DINO